MLDVPLADPQRDSILRNIDKIDQVISTHTSLTPTDMVEMCRKSRHSQVGIVEVAQKHALGRLVALTARALSTLLTEEEFKEYRGCADLSKLCLECIGRR